MNKVVKIHWSKVFDSAFIVVCTGLIVTACSKNPTPEENSTALASSPSASASQPTGLVKNPVNHSKVADVTQWMDQASTKTAAQREQEEKLAREAKEKQALEAKHQLDSKTAVNKPVTRDILVPALASAQAQAPAPAPAPVQAATKTIEVAPASPVIAAAAPVASANNATTKSAPTDTSDRQVLKAIASSQPKYPSTAARAGITEGKVSARIHVDPDGKVSQVEILSARPKRFFDQEVISTVSQWKYAPIAKAQTTVMEFTFKLE